MLPYIKTRRPDGSEGISVVIGHKTHFIAASAAGYADVLEALKPASGKTDAEVAALVHAEEARLHAAMAAARITDNVSIAAGQVLFRGEPAGNFIATRMLEMLRDGFDLQPMARFLEHLMENPSYRVVENLYEFLEKGGIPLTPDGCFLAYKAVRADYTDIYSGSMNNAIGCVVRMPRNQVDENPEQTCSRGLHVCSFDYLPSFAHANGHVVVCKVNPRNVVAIPRDYQATKMRVCEYTVVDEYAGYYQEHPECAWSQSVVDDYDPEDDDPDGVTADADDEDIYGYSVYDSADSFGRRAPACEETGYPTLEDAKLAAIEVEAPFHRVTVWRNHRDSVCLTLQDGPDNN